MFGNGTPGAGTLQRRTRRLLSPVVRRLWHIDMHGYDRLPADGPAILCPNHISFLDSAFLMLTVPRNISFVGKAEYMDSWKTKYIFPAMGMIPIDRAGGDKSQSALDTAAGVLAARRAVRHLPGGHAQPRRPRCTRGAPGPPAWRCRSGARSSRSASPAPTPSSRRGPRRPSRSSTARSTSADPSGPERYRDRREPHLASRSMIDEVMFEIREMTGQEYRNHYTGEKPRTAIAQPVVAPAGERHRHRAVAGPRARGGRRPVTVPLGGDDA